MFRKEFASLKQLPTQAIDMSRFTRIGNQHRNERSAKDQHYYENVCSHDSMTEKEPPQEVILMNGEIYNECEDCGYSQTRLYVKKRDI